MSLFDHIHHSWHRRICREWHPILKAHDDVPVLVRSLTQQNLTSVEMFGLSQGIVGYWSYMHIAIQTWRTVTPDRFENLTLFDKLVVCGEENPTDLVKARNIPLQSRLFFIHVLQMPVTVNRLRNVDIISSYRPETFEAHHQEITAWVIVLADMIFNRLQDKRHYVSVG